MKKETLTASPNALQLEGRIHLSMETLDLVLLGLLVVFALRGFWRGLFYEVMAVVSVVAATGAGLLLAPHVGPWIADRVPLPAGLVSGVAFFVVFFPMVALVRLLRMIVGRSLPGAGESPFNSIGGLFFGTFKGALVLGAIIALLRAPVVGDNVAYGSPVQRSVIGPLATVQKTIDRSVIAVGMSSMAAGCFSLFGDFKQFTASAARVGRP